MKTLIDDGQVHVLDGAMGTELYARGVFVNVCYDQVTLERPELVGQIHRDYVSAGAEVLETNTFGANPVKLSSYGLAERTEEINRTAALLARDAAGGRALVAGAVGPLGIRIEPWGPTGLDEAIELFRRQIEGLLDGGVDGLMLETFSDLAEIECALKAARSETDLPVFAQVSVGQDGKTEYGTDAAQVGRALAALGTDVVGLNCSVGPAVMLDAVEEMAEVTELPLSAQPNAGLPRTVRGRQIYLASPEYMAEYARRIVDSGVRFVGGCCGTTPAHIRAIRDAVRSGPATAAAVRPSPVVLRTDAPLREATQLEERSGLGAKLARGAPVVSVEILPPPTWEPEELLGPARALEAAGVDVVSLVDSGDARSRVGSLAAAALIDRELHIEAVAHYACRGRTMLGMISDLLGAAATGVRNLLVVTGDPPALGPYAGATANLDIDAIGLTHVVQALNRGIDPGGNPIGTPTRFVQGVALNQGAADPARELERLRYKIEAGADFAVTQPVFDVGALEPYLEVATAAGLPVLAGVWPFPNLRSAEFLANEVPGVHVPPEAVERMRKAEASGKDASTEEGVSIALEVIHAVQPLTRGFHLSAPRRNVEAALRVLREADLGVGVQAG